MSYQKHLLTSENSPLSNDDYMQLALEALSIVAKHESEDLNIAAPRDMFFQAFAFGDDSDRQRVVSSLRKDGSSDDDLIDTFVPETARRIGEMWVRDDMSFGQVTIAATHLQELVRSIGGIPDRLNTTIPLGLSVLIVIPAGETHTMGAFVAADQFRRLGLMVHMAICQTPEEIASVVKSQSFAMIGISSASRRRVQDIANIVSTIRENGVNTPIVLGGNIVHIVKDPVAATGVDMVTTNAKEAARFCGLPVQNDVLKEPLF